MKKWWVKVLLAFGVILLVVFTWILAASVQSNNSVDRYRDQLRAAGEKLSIDDLIPPRVDPDKNGADLFDDASRCIGPYLTGALGSNSPLAMKIVAPGKAMVGWRQTEIVSILDNHFVTNSWSDIEQEIGVQRSAIDLLQQASERPKINFDLDYRQGYRLLLPHESKLKQAALLLSADAECALHGGDCLAAVKDLHTFISLVNARRDEPLLISQLVRIAMAQIAVNAQWELLQATNLTDQQLATLQSDWTTTEFIQPMENALLMERAMDSQMIQELRSSNSPSALFSGSYGSGGSGGGIADWLAHPGDVAKRKAADTLWRISWSYDDELAVLEGNQVLVETVREIRTNGYFKDGFKERDLKLAALGLNHPNTNWLRNKFDDQLIELGLPDSVSGVGNSLDHLLSMEAARRIVVVSIAIKRYQLRHGASPDNLNALVPEFLPQVPADPVDGHPLRYRLNPDGSFVLYSIGKDGVDNGGDPAPDRPLNSLSWLRARDWVWPQPATTEEIQKFYQNPPK